MRSRSRRTAPRKKTLFEALEQRFLLSAELVVPPPPPPQAVLEAPLELNQPGQIKVTLQIDDAGSAGTIGESNLSQSDPVQGAESSATPTAALDAAAARPGSLIALADFAAFMQDRPAASQVVIVDAGIPDVDKVVQGIADALATGDDTQDPSAVSEDAESADVVLPSVNTSSEGPQVRWLRQNGVDIIVLDARYDGIEQIGSILSSYQNLDAVQVLSHGDSGALQLGTSQLNGENLQDHAAQVQAWGAALRSGGDILLYGCDVAQGAYGVNFVQSLAQLTGADVAASDNATGDAAKGGNWLLEHATGNIEAQTVRLQAYSWLLDNMSGTSGDDTLISTAMADHMTGLAGNDTYKFSDNWGIDTVSDSAGIDTLDFSLVTKNLTFTIRTDGSILVTDGTADNTVTATGIENLIGGSGVNTFVFENGATLAGTISGKAGGDDVLDYSRYTTAVAINLATNAATGTQGATNIGRVIGGNGVNTLTGANEEAVWKITAAGSGKIGNYLSFSGFANLVGGTASDTLDYSGYATAITVDLSASSATGFSTITGFNNVIGSAFADTIIGDDGDNILSGGLGNDFIKGGGGHDTLAELRDADMVLTDTKLTIGSEVDTFEGMEAASLTGGAGNNRLDASAVTTLTVYLDGDDGDDVLLGGALNDTLLGGLGNDSLDGGDGDDTLSGGGGVDTIVGGDGINTLVESGDTRFVLTDATLDMGQGTSEVQTISFTGTVTGGTFVLTYKGEKTSVLAHDADAQTV
ncbi:MAG TPA: DUF4347 domain-containing protein, partial [Noviherbaspirillum sp.]